MLATQSQESSFISRHKLLVANVTISALLFFAMSSDYFATQKIIKTAA